MEKFFSDNTIERANGCIEWVGRISNKGYGAVSHTRFGTPVAHRANYLHKIGNTQLVLDHLCRNTVCVNTDHLEAVTQAENIFRGKSTKRTRTECSNGHTLTVDNISYKSGKFFRCRDCAREECRKRRAKLKAMTGLTYVPKRIVGVL